MSTNETTTWGPYRTPIQIGHPYWDYNLSVSIVLGVQGQYDHGTTWYDTTGGMFDASRLAGRNPYDGKPASLDKVDDRPLWVAFWTIDSMFDQVDNPDLRSAYNAIQDEVRRRYGDLAVDIVFDAFVGATAQERIAAAHDYSNTILPIVETVPRVNLVKIPGLDDIGVWSCPTCDWTSTAFDTSTWPLPDVDHTTCPERIAG